MEDFFRVGIVTKPHGLRGEVKVYPTTECPKRFLSLKEVLVRNKEEEFFSEVENVRFFKNLVILKLSGFDSVEEAQNLRQRELYVSRENALPVQEGEYYVPDLIGIKVSTDEGLYLGVIEDVLETGANDVYEIKSPEHGNVLIPAINQCILKVDIQAREMIVHLLPGLI